jgi:hypothetical protein
MKRHLAFALTLICLTLLLSGTARAEWQWVHGNAGFPWSPSGWAISTPAPG